MNENIRFVILIYSRILNKYNVNKYINMNALIKFLS